MDQKAPLIDAYSEGMRIATGLKDLDGPNVNPACQTRLYSHGHRTERALALLHGFTNCPQQFDALGRQFHEKGWNVVIPRYPRHGYMDRLNTAIAELRTEHLTAVANRATAAAAGLGERVTVAGLSLGGILAGHLAQTRDGIERAVLMAPMFGLRPIPARVLIGATRLAQLLPNFYMWWDAGLKEKIGPPHGYPRFSTRAYAALFETAADVLASARVAAPRVAHIVVVTNANEPRLDNRFTYQLIEAWRAHGAKVTSFEFPASDKLPHDLIDPAQTMQNTALVYPVVSRFIEGD